jgi:GNAT superfamily N-acetyltransferase
VTIREATLEDQVVVLELARQFLATTSYHAFAGPPEQLEVVFTLVRQHGVVFLAEDAEGVAGMIALAAVPHLFTGTRYAEEIAWFVRPDRRGSSAATRLLAAAEEWARHQGLWCLKMGAPSDEPSVGRLYERRGYQAVETSFMKRW